MKMSQIIDGTRSSSSDNGLRRAIEKARKFKRSRNPQRPQ